MAILAALEVGPPTVANGSFRRSLPPERTFRLRPFPGPARPARSCPSAPPSWFHELLGPPCVDQTNVTTNMTPLGCGPHSRGSVPCCRRSLTDCCGSLYNCTSTGSDRSKKLNDLPCASRLSDEFTPPSSAPRSTKFSPLSSSSS